MSLRSALLASVIAFGLAPALAGVLPAQAGEPTWRQVPTEPYRLNNKQDALAFGSPTVGLYGNGTGRVFRTEDAGAHWREAWRRPGTYVRALDMLDAHTGVMGNVGPGYFDGVTDRQPLYVTRDGGAHWAPAAPVSGPPVTGICAVDVLRVDGTVRAVRAGGRVGGPAALMTSLDGGATWTSRDMGALTGMVLDIHFTGERTGFIAGASESDEARAHARILKTDDGGEHWRAVFDSPRPGDVNWKLAFPSARVGYATIISYGAPRSEGRGYVVKTEDGGEHWRRLPVTADHDWIPYGIAFLDERRGWVGGATGGFETLDGGDTWHPAAMGLSTNKFRLLPLPGGGTRVLALGQSLYSLDLPPQ